MSRFQKLTHVLWHCQYHIIWVPKYRYRVLKGDVARETTNCIHAFCKWLGCEVVELSVQEDHVHLIAKIPPKVSVSEFMGTVKGRTAIRVFKQFPRLKQKPYWENRFWAPGYCVDTIGLDEDKVRRYVKYQEQNERLEEQKI